MNGLKGTLIGIYVALILLLVLTNLKSCHGTERHDGPDTVEQRRDLGEEEDDDDVIDTDSLAGEQGRLRVALKWNFKGDADIHVVTPSGTCVDFKNPNDVSSGGRQDVDEKSGGSGSAENIYWNEPANGTYSVFIHYFPNANFGGRESGPVKIVVQTTGIHGETNERVFDSSLSQWKEWKGICKFTYKDGKVKFLKATSARPQGGCVIASNPQMSLSSGRAPRE